MNFTKHISNSLFFASVAGSRRRRWIAACALLAAVVISLAQFNLRPAQAERGSVLQGDAALAHLKEQGLYGSLEEAMQAARYSVNPAMPAKQSFQADNPAQQLDAQFTRDGVQLRPANDRQNWSLGMKLRGVGYGERLSNVTPGEVSAQGNRVEIRHQSQIPNLKSQITEWYVNKPEGLEQGFTLDAAPGERRAGEQLRLALALDGDLRAQVVDDGQAIELRRGEATVLSYDHLVVRDARGQQLPAAMRVAKGEVWLEVDDAEAQYPVTIDPTFVHFPINKITAPTRTVYGQFGQAVAMRGDTVVIGEPRSSENRGAAYIFVRSGLSYNFKLRLTASDAAVNDFFGYSVAISGDTVVVGADGNNNARGAAYVFVGAGANWSQQAKLVSNDREEHSRFGRAVAIDSHSVVVGAPYKDDSSKLDAGSGYVFVRSGTTWSQQAKLLFATNPGDLFGSSVAISNNTIAVGVPYDNIMEEPEYQDMGTVRIYERTGTTWMQMSALPAPDQAIGDLFGSAVALNDHSLVVGAPGEESRSDRPDEGAVYFFTRSGGGFSSAGKFNTAGSAYANLGSSVALSGNQAVVGARNRKIGAKGSQGAVYFYERNGPTWTSGMMLTAGDGVAGDFYGTSVAISNGTILVGAPGDDSGQGSAYVWDQVHKLIANDGTAGDAFGGSVAVSGDTVVVGAYADDSARGSVYVFMRAGAGYSLPLKLVANDGAPSDQFGRSVAISSDTVVVGAPGDDVERGAAYVFVGAGANWSQQAKLLPSDPETGASFGHAVAIDGSSIVVGAPYKDFIFNGGSFENAGAGYVFVRSGSTWSQQARLRDNLNVGNYSGLSVAINGDRIAVGIPGAKIPFNAYAGSVDIYERSGTVWTYRNRLATINEGQDGDRFGHSVALSGNVLVVGAPGDDYGYNTDSGAVYVYKRSRTNWSLDVRLIGAATGDNLGNSVAISGEAMVIGAPGVDIVGNKDQGSAYIYGYVGTDWILKGNLKASDGLPNDNLGNSVAISGNTILVGAAGASSYRGAAYIVGPPTGGSTTTSARLKTMAGGTASDAEVSQTAEISHSNDAEIASPATPEATRTDRAARCYRWITPVNHVFAHAGGEGTINMAASDGCEWTAASEADWITISSSASGSGAGIVTFTVAENPSELTRTGTLTVAGQKITIAQSAPLVTVSAASFAGDTAAPESIVAAFGNQLAKTTEAATEQTLPTTLGETKVSVRDGAGRERFAPLFFVSPNQINFQIPPGAAPGRALVMIINDDETVAAGAVQIEMTAPSLFSADLSGQGLVMGVALRVRADGSQSYEPIARYDEEQKRFVATPIDPGAESDRVYLILFATGVRHRESLGRVSVKIGGEAAEAHYAGPGGELTGMDQLNVLLPRSLAERGEVEVALAVDGVAANLLKIAVR